MASEELYDREQYENGYLQELQKQTQLVESKSLRSTMRALARLQQAEEIAGSSMTLLQQQAETLTSIERNDFKVEEKLESADKQVDKLKALNRFFMIPAFKKSNPIKNIFKRERASPPTNQHSAPIALPIVDKNPVEIESVEGNLREISNTVSRLKMMGLGFGSELDSQNERLGKLNSRIDDSKIKLTKINRKVNKLLD
ncbi:Synaptosomal-associated protein 23 [Boothiomyces sp. JEL0866]|nr:Synaptosomal-associated protein 23 [Boothiomyces sp. JEL0866]